MFIGATNPHDEISADVRDEGEPDPDESSLTDAEESSGESEEEGTGPLYAPDSQPGGSHCCFRGVSCSDHAWDRCRCRHRCASSDAALSGEERCQQCTFLGSRLPISGGFLQSLTTSAASLSPTYSYPCCPCCPSSSSSIGKSRM